MGPLDIPASRVRISAAAALLDNATFVVAVSSHVYGVCVQCVVSITSQLG